MVRLSRRTRLAVVASVGALLTGLGAPTALAAPAPPVPVPPAPAAPASPVTPPDPLPAASAYPAYGSVVIPGWAWLLGQGSNVMSNGQLRFDGVWQCTEIAQRAYERLGWPRVRTAVNGGAAYIPEGTPALVRHDPGTGYVPSPGDLVVENPRSGNPYGHVSVVDWVAGTSVHAVEQNGSASHRHTYTLGARGTLTGAYSTVKAVLHAPQNSFDSRGTTRAYGDWDGDGDTTPGVVVRSGSYLVWQLTNETSGGYAQTSFPYGRVGDVPVVGDWDGDGRDEIGVVRRSGTGLTWLLRRSTTGGAADITFGYGTASDQPVVGDWDGKGGDGVGIVRRDATGGPRWHLKLGLDGGPATMAFSYGLPGDIPVSGNWDGKGGDSVAVARPVGSGLVWYLRDAPSAGAARPGIVYGWSTDYPVAGDWDGNGTDTIGLQRTLQVPQVQWYLRNANRAGGADLAVTYGDAGSAFVG